MRLDYVPLLKIQRDLYELPRGFERFREYLRTMTDPESGDLKFPLVAMNPMGKDHVTALLDALAVDRAEPLFLDGVHELPVDDEGSGRVAVEGVQAQDRRHVRRPGVVSAPPTSRGS